MKKRAFIFGAYNTATEGWTLTSWKLSPPVLKSQYVDKPGGDGSWDLSTALTDGLPRYEDRTLTATFELSTGDRASREAIIRNMVNTLSGQRVNISTPDDTDYYLTGRVSVAREYNDLAHAAVTVTAVCEPWKYAYAETVIALAVTSEERTVDLFNGGSRTVVPLIKVAGVGTFVYLSYGDSTLALSPGTHQWSDLLLTPGSHILTYHGGGTLTISYREAVLE